MLDRFIARIPALLLLGVVVLGALAVAGEDGRPVQLLASLPAALLAAAYLRAGRGARRGSPP